MAQAQSTQDLRPRRRFRRLTARSAGRAPLALIAPLTLAAALSISDAPATAANAALESAPSGAATTTATTAGVSNGAVAAWNCARNKIGYKSRQNLRIRASRSTRSRTLGILPAGHKACMLGGSRPGGWYHACGKTSNWWAHVQHGSARGWAADACLRGVR